MDVIARDHVDGGGRVGQSLRIPGDRGDLDVGQLLQTEGLQIPATLRQRRLRECYQRKARKNVLQPAPALNP